MIFKLIPEVKLILAGIFFMTFILPNHVEARGQGKKKPYFLHVGFKTIKAKKFYNNDGKDLSGLTYRQQAINLYGEYYMNSWLKSTWKWTFIYHLIEKYGEEQGMGDPEVTLVAMPIPQLPFFNIGAGASFPLGDLDTKDSLKIGEGEYSLHGMAVLRSPWPKARGAFYGHLKYQYRFGGLTDIWQYYTRVGARIKNEARVHLAFRGQRMMKTANPSRINPIRSYGEGVEVDEQGIMYTNSSFGSLVTIGYFNRYFGEARNFMKTGSLEVGVGFRF